MFDSSLDIKYGLRSTVTPSEFVVCNRSRELVLRAATTRDAEDWIAAIKKKARESAFCARNRFLSFAPHRTSSLCSSSVTWLLNGQPYFDAVEDALLSSEREILIAGWFITPMIRLRRKQLGEILLEPWLQA